MVTSVAEFQACLQELESDEAGLLYRGQADAAWPVSCSAARRLTQDPANSIEDQLIISLLIGYLEFLIAKARMRGFLPPGFSETSPDLELLAQLQHQGAATGLIDFTRHPFVALWFACNEAYEGDGAVYILSRSATEEISNSRNLQKQIQSFYEEGTLWSWEPSTRGNRIVAQSSVFVFGVAAVASDRMERFTIKAENKSDILSQLETVYGVNEEMLFPDFPGFAVANASNKPFDVKRTVAYWREQVELASDDSSQAMAYFYCGVAYSAVQDFQNATEQYSEAIRLNPDYTHAYTNRGIARDILGQSASAIADFDEAIRIDPKNYKAYNGRASPKAALGRYEEAIADYNEAIRINPDYAEAYNNRGADKDALGKHTEAIADYDAAIRINPEIVGAYLNRGSTKAKLARYEEAIADYDAAIRINPAIVNAYVNRGAVQSALGRYEEAIADYDAAIAFNPNLAEAYANRGTAQTALGRFEESIADSDAAIALNPNLAEAYANRGTAQTALGRFEEAIADSDAAIGFSPNLAEAYVNRGMAKRFLRQLAAAREDLERARYLAEEQGLTDLLRRIEEEWEDLDSDSDNPPSI